MERLILRAHTDTRKGKTERIKSFPGCGLDKTKEMQFDMEKEEIYEMVIQEMTEHALTQRREACSEEEKKLYQEENELSEKARHVLEGLPAEERQVVDDYVATTNLIAQQECEYLYIQGEKDCVELLRKLGVL